MTQDFYQKALYAAKIERARLLGERRELDERRAELEQRIASLDETINGLSVLSGESLTKPTDVADRVKGLGLADACRVMLSTSDTFMSALRVRNMLNTVDYDFKEQVNPLASIHAILKRFVESGEAEALEVGGRTGYRLIRQGTARPAETKGKKKKARVGSAILHRGQESRELIQDTFDLEEKEKKE